MDRLELRQQDDALLLVRIGARDDGGRRFGLAQIVGLMRNVGGDVDEVAGAVDHVILEPLAVPHADFAAEHMERRLVRLVLVRLGPSAGRNREKLHVDRRGADRLGGNRRRVGKTLLADERFACPQAGADRRLLDGLAHVLRPFLESRPYAPRTRLGHGAASVSRIEASPRSGLRRAFRLRIVGEFARLKAPSFETAPSDHRGWACQPATTGAIRVRLFWYPAKPRPAKPISIIAQVEASGTAALTITSKGPSEFGSIPPTLWK